jgi:cysteine/glycine-rich protein
MSGSPKTSNGPKFGGSDQCPTCNKVVYFAEQVIGPQGIKYHKLCFKCIDCNKLLDPSNCTDNEGKVYCKSCHGKNFGPKGYGFSSGSAFLTTEKTI